MERSDRRNFFGLMVRSAARNTQTLAAATLPMPVAALVSATRTTQPKPKTEVKPPPVVRRAVARTPARSASRHDLDILAGAVGLSHRRSDLRAIASDSVRLCDAGEGDGDGWLADMTTLRELMNQEAPLVAQLNLAAPQLKATPLAGTGWLHLYVERWAASPSTSSHHVAVARARVLEKPLETPASGSSVAMRSELVLPRVWSAHVGDLSLDQDESDAYVSLRRDLANIQGVEADDDGGATIAYQRLLGYPNETSGLMPKMCADANSDEPDAAVHRAWRLVAQLSPAIGSERLYFWARTDDLERDKVDQLVAVGR